MSSGETSQEKTSRCKSFRGARRFAERPNYHSAKRRAAKRRARKCRGNARFAEHRFARRCAEKCRAAKRRVAERCGERRRTAKRRAPKRCPSTYRAAKRGTVDTWCGNSLRAKTSHRDVAETVAPIRRAARTLPKPLRDNKLSEKNRIAAGRSVKTRVEPFRGEPSCGATMSRCKTSWSGDTFRGITSRGETSSRAETLRGKPSCGKS